MTDSIDDGDGGRDDDFDWERGGESPTTRDQLARLREELSRSSESGRRRGGREDPASEDATGADLPGSLDRAIARVGGLFDDVGPASDARGVRDPYADFGDQGPPASYEEDYEDPYREPVARTRHDQDPEPYSEPPPRRERSRRDPDLERGAGTAYGRDRETDYDSYDDDPAGRGARRGAPERRAARSRKADLSYDDAIGAEDAAERADFREPYQARDELERSAARRPAQRRRELRDAAWDDGPRRGRLEERDEPGYARRAPKEEPPAPRETPRRVEKSRGPKRKKSRGAVMDAEEAAAQAEATRGRGSAPFGSLERMLAGRYLRARRKEGFISVIAMLSLLGITLAVAVLIVVMSVMNGFRTEFVSKIVGVDGHMTVQPFDRSLEGYEETARKVRSVAGVTRAAPMIKGQAFATSRYGGVGVLVRGMSKADLLGVEKVAVSPERSAGSLANFGVADGIAIGEGLANKLGIGVGDTMNVISPQGSVTPFGVAPKRRVFEVIYVFKIGISWYDNALVFMPIKDAQTFFNRPGGADVIDVQVATPDQLDGYTEDIRATAGSDLSIRTWMDENGTMIGALKTEQSVMFLILSMLILIASLIIISGLIMLVQEKGPDIAILRTMGLSRGGVLRVFFMCGATIGLIGVVVGVSLGVLVALNISDIKEFIEAQTGTQLFPSEVYLFSKLPSRLDWNDVGFTVLITLGLSFVATLYPAWRAARMDPVEALRYE